MELSQSERERLLRTARWCIGAFIGGLFLSGVTAFPLETELRAVVRFCDGVGWVPGTVLAWLHRVYAAVADENARYPFLAYGTDWLAFAHVVLAVLFIGPWVDPVRNKWVVAFGFVACAGVLPLALIAGFVRGIPVYWRMIDCSFGVFGAVVLWPAWRAVRGLEGLTVNAKDAMGRQRELRQG